MQSGVDMHMCLKKLSLNPCIRKIIDEYKATSEERSDGEIRTPRIVITMPTAEGISVR